MLRSPFIRFFTYIRWNIILKTFSRAVTRRVFGLSSEMAFNAMLALFPSLLAVFTALGIFQESLDSITNIVFQYEKVIPPTAWDLLTNVVKQISYSANRGLFSLSFVAAIWVSSGAISTAMNSLDEIHQIPRKKRRPYWLSKLISIFIALGFIILLILAFYIVIVGNTWVNIADNLITKLPFDNEDSALILLFWQLFCWPIALGIAITATALLYQIYRLTKKPHPEKIRRAKNIVKNLFIAFITIVILIFTLFFLNDLIIKLKFNYTTTIVLIKIWQFFSLPLALAIVSIAFAFLYRVGPSIRTVDTPFVPGAIIAAIAWAFVSHLFRLYVLYFSSLNRLYGVVGTVIILMIWLQITALVMLLGDQLNVTVWEAMKSDQQKQTKQDLAAK